MKAKHLTVLIVIFTIYIGVGGGNSMLGAAWPVAGADIAGPISRENMLTILTCTMAVMGAVASTNAQRLLARYHAWMPATLGIVLCAASVFAFSAQNTFWIALICCVVLGFAFGTEGAVVNGYVTKHYSASAMSWLHCCFSIGCMVGPAILSYFIAAGSWRSGYQALGIIVACILAALLVTRPLFRAHSPAPRRAVETAPIKTKSGRELMRAPGGIIIPFGMFFYASFDGLIIYWAASFLTSAKGMSADVAAALMAYFFGTQLVGRIICGFLTMRFSDRAITRTALIAMFAFAVLMAFTSGNPFIFSFVALGFVSGPVFPLLIHEVPQIVGEERAQGLIGLQLAGANLGFAVVPTLMGFISNFWSLSIYPYFVIVMVGVALILKLALDRRVKLGL